MASFWKHLCVGICVMGVVFPGGGIALCEVLEEETPADLMLDAEEEARSQAMAHFAWGLYLQMTGNQPPKEFLEHYRLALTAAPDSKVIFEHLIAPWLMQGKHGRVAEALAPIAAEHVDVPHVQAAYVDALLA